MSFLLLSASITLAGIFITPTLFLHSHRDALQAPGRKESDIYLLKSPNHFTGLDILYLVLRLVTKYLRSTLQLSTSLEPSRSVPQAFRLERIQIQGLLYITPEDVTRFETAVNGGSQNDRADSKCNALLLPAMTGSLVIYLLTSPACPIKPVGAVNTRNRIRFVSPICQDTSTLISASRKNRISYSATFGSTPGRRVKRGIEFDIHIDIYVAEGSRQTCVMKQELSYLQFLAPNILPLFAGQMEGKVDFDDFFAEGLPDVDIAVGKDAPKKWAACNRDFNPIHISPIGARLLGQKSVIAHGMHVVALALERIIEGEGQEEVRAREKDMCWGCSKGWTLEMKFVKPINLPAVVSTRSLLDQDGGVHMGLVKSGRVVTSLRAWREE